MVAGARVRNNGILKMEKAMLGRVDFLANSADNGCRRLDVLETLFPTVEEEGDYENIDTETLRRKLKEKDRVIKELRTALALEKAKTERLCRTKN